MADNMTPDTDSPPAATRSSVLYALGKLTAETEAHRKEIARVADAQEALPDRVVAAINPRFVAIETRQAKDEDRISSLERWMWLHAGGLGVIVTGLGWAILVVKPALFRT